MSTPVIEQAPPAAPTAPARWEGIIGVEGEATGDGRLINHGALRWDFATEVPKLRFVVSDVGAHDGAVVVGKFDTIERRPGGLIWASGTWDTSPDAVEAQRLVGEEMLNGISMDLDDVSFEVRVRSELLEDAEGDEAPMLLAMSEPDEDGRVTVVSMGSDDEMMVTTDGRVRSSTLVAIPAFARARINNVALTAAIDNVDSMPEGDDVAEGSDGDALYDEALATLEQADQAEFLSPEYLSGADAAGDLFAQAAQALAETNPEKAAVAADTAANLKRFASLPWGDPAEVETREAGPTVDTAPALDAPELVAGAAPLAPPKEWFADPGLSEPTPLTVTPEGRVYGHLATWDVCHVASPAGSNICVTAPHSHRGYADFHLGGLETAEGEVIGVGKITMGTGHAKSKMTANAAAAHYDNTGTGIADVRAGEDMFGIWIAGALVPEATPEQVRTLRASPLSGDWREVAGHLELKAALAVNVPGFPVPRPGGLTASGANGDSRLVTLVASGMLAPAAEPDRAVETRLSAADVDYLHTLIHRQRTEDAAKLASEVHAIRDRRTVQQFAASRRKG